ISLPSVSRCAGRRKIADQVRDDGCSLITETLMFERTYYGTHPDMMECVSNEELRDRYLIQGLFRAGECVLNYTQADRFVIGGVLVGAGAVKLPAQTEPPSAAGHPFLERRELAIVNVGKMEGTVTVD